MRCASGVRSAATERQARTEHGDFADLLCVEPGWVDIEFAEIIAANFGAAAFEPDVPAPLPPHRDNPVSRPERREFAPLGRASPRRARPTTRIGACERSPPPAPVER
jgi:phage tail protein X